MGTALRFSIYAGVEGTELGRREEMLNYDVVTSKAYADLTGNTDAGLAFIVVSIGGSG